MRKDDTPGHGHEHELQGAVSERFLEHLKQPANVGSLEPPHGAAALTGQCGDSIGVHISVAQGILADIRVQPQGCGYTTACASALSVLVKGRSLEDALWLEPEDVAAELDGLPEDHLHCARLAVNTLGEAIADYYEQEHRKGRATAAPGTQSKQEG